MKPGEEINTIRPTEPKLQTGHQFLNLIDGLPDAVYTCNSEGEIFFYNRAAVALWGTIPTPGKDMWYGPVILYKTDGTIVSPDTRPFANTLITGTADHDEEYILQRTDGSKRIVIFRPQITHEKDGQPASINFIVHDITDTKKAQQDTARLAAIVQSSNDAIISKTLDGIITSWNPGAERIFGYTEKEMIGTHITRLLPLDRLDEEMKIIDQLKKGEVVDHFITKRITKDGRLIDISLTISPIKDVQGRITGAAKIARDITEQQRLHATLLENEDKLKVAVHAARLGTWELQLKPRQGSFSKRYLEILGFEQNENPDHEDLLRKIHPEDRPIRDAAMEKAMQTGVLEVEMRIQASETSLKWIKVNGQVFFDHTGEPERMLGTIMDITSEKETFLALKESQERLVTALEAAELGAWEISYPDMKIDYSKRYLEIFGFNENDQPTYEELKARIHPDDMNLRDELMRQAFSTGKLDMEFRIYSAEGTLRWIKAKASVSYDDNKQPVRMLGTVMDITKQKKSFEALRESENQMNHLADAMPQLVWIAKPAGEVIYYNNRIGEYANAFKNEKGEWEWAPMVHPDDEADTLQTWNRSVETGAIFSKEHRIQLKNGTYRWHLSRGYPEKDEKGAIVKWYGTATDIDDIKRIQNSLRLSEERLRLAMEATEMGTWSIDLATGRAITSAKHRDLMGYESMENLTGEEYLKYLHPDDRPKVDAEYKKGLEQGYYYFEARVLRPGRPMNWVKVHGKTIYDEEGKPKTVLGTITDITKDKNAANEVVESEERFRMIANTAPVMIWMSGSDKYSDFFNTSWLNFTGRTIEQEQGDGWKEAVHPDDLAKCVATYNNAFEKQEPFHIEYRLLRYDGKYRWISDNAIPRYTPEGTFIGFISACMDIDDEKKFNEKLQESELLFKTIASVSPVGLWMTDTEGRTNFINATWSEWTGMPARENLLNNWYDAAVLTDRNDLEKLLTQKIQTRQKFNYEFRFKRNDGEVRWGVTEGFPYYDDEGDFSGYAGSITDITDRKQNEMLKNDFLTVASHELKTPLTSIKAYSQLLSKTYEKANDAFLKNGLTKVSNQVNKMTKLVNDFLNLSKIESEKFQLYPETFDITELLKEIAADIQMVAINHPLVLKHTSPVFVWADKEKISQVITNFLNNAVKYSPEDKTITLDVRQENDWVTVYIADKGIGVESGEQEKIFHRFYRSQFNNNISFSGFGIGLYISAEIIDRHNGKIGVNSEKGKGAEFYFSLPVTKP